MWLKCICFLLSQLHFIMREDRRALLNLPLSLSLSYLLSLHSPHAARHLFFLMFVRAGWKIWTLSGVMESLAWQLRWGFLLLSLLCERAFSIFTRGSGLVHGNIAIAVVSMITVNENLVLQWVRNQNKVSDSRATYCIFLARLRSTRLAILFLRRFWWCSWLGVCIAEIASFLAFLSGICLNCCSLETGCN